MVEIKKYNEAYGYIESDDSSTIMDIWERLTFYAEGFRYMPSYKDGTWDGKIRLMNLLTRQFPLGLVSEIESFLDMMGVDYVVDTEVRHSFDSGVSEEEIREFIKKFKFYSKKKEIFPREDQIRAVVRSIKLNRCVNICPTSFGKSLAIFIQSLWHIEHGRKVSIIVPTVGLVNQFANDIKDYCTDSENFTTSWLPSIRSIHAKSKEKETESDITVTTWQSVYKEPEKFVKDVDVIILDECHKGKSKSIQDIFSCAENVIYRTGWTGSLEETEVNRLVAQGCMGEIEEITDTKTLMDAGIVADMTVRVLKFSYPEEIRKQVNGLDYPSEIKYINNNKLRMKKLCALMKAMPKTGLLLFRYIKHGQDFQKVLTKACPDKNIYMIHGGHFERNGTRYKSIEELKGFMEEDKDGIILANYQIFSTGLSVKNLHWIIFGAPTRSYITTIQSIGRGLRISDSKKKITLIDVVDDFTVKKKNGTTKNNYCMKHFYERFKIYNSRKFKYSITNVKIE